MDDNVIKALEHVTGAFQDAVDIFKKLAGPLAYEVGEMLGAKAREYRLRNAIKILLRTKKMLADAQINPQPIPPRLFLPAIQAASTEDNDILQERWAALLANASNPALSQSVLPSFVEVLKEMTPEEARLMTSIYEKAMTPEYLMEDGKIPHDRGKMIGTFHEMESLIGLSPTRFASRKDQQAALVVDDLVRLGLVDRLPWYPTSRADPSELLARQPGESQYFLTPFGLAFMSACRAPK
jgi:hypothetical protein